MPVYSPPVTRQRARALIIAQQQQRVDRREDEQRKLQLEQVRGSDRRLRPQQQRSATGKKAEEAGGRNSEPEKPLARRKGAGGEPSRPRTRGASHARALSGGEGRVGSLAAAETRPVTAGTLGNSGSRWCLKGASRSTRRGGGSGNGGGRNPDSNSTSTAWESGEVSKAAGREGEGETMIEMAEEPRCALISSCPSADTPGVAAEQPRPEVGGPAAGGADDAEADEASPLLSSSSSPPASLQQPLEEVNPSVLNTKANGNCSSGGSGNGSSNSSARGRGDNSGDSSGGVSAGGVRSRGVGVGGGVGTGKEGGDPAEGEGLAAAVVGGDGRADDGGRGSVVGVEDSTAAAAAPDADAEDSAAENSTTDRRRGGVFSDGRRNATESCGEVSECMVDRRGAAVDGGRGAEPKDTDAGGGGGFGSQRGRSAVSAPAADDGVGVAALRARGKSIDTEEDSTGVISPVQKRNRRELKLSEEETAMAGAPQGPVYQVQVLDAGDFERSPNPEEEMQAVLAAAGGGGDWADLYSAVDSARRLCIFHSGVLVREGNLEGAVGLMVTAVGNLRSSMVRNALLGVGDMFRLLGQEMGKVNIRAMVAGTLQRFAGEKRFICNTAAQAMEAAARSGLGVKVLDATLPSIHDRKPEVSAKSAFFAEKCLASLGVGSKAGVGLPSGLEFHSLVMAFAKASNGKLAEGRMAGRRGLLRSRKAVGPGPFEAALTESLGKAEATTLLAALTAPNRDTGSARAGNVGNSGGVSRGVGGDSRGRGGAGTASTGGGGGGCRNSVAAGRPSIREQMMAAKRKKQEEEKQRRAAKEDGAGDRATSEAGGFVIVT